ncbi:hypothetical protein J8J32_22405, partial [Mycobacterium tuberculosis]|uniref:hypothetical protein n=1 Tax=Mycobacterium tuberculosis TaxID=1773 RepID=UPI001AE09CC7|nr:hypothetical protein [Mycobacterium tuberculosis]
GMGLEQAGQARQTLAGLLQTADPSLGEPLLRGNNPLLPSSVLRLPIGQLNRGASGDFDWARERLRVLSADSTPELEREYA